VPEPLLSTKLRFSGKVEFVVVVEAGDQMAGNVARKGSSGVLVGMTRCFGYLFMQGFYMFIC